MILFPAIDLKDGQCVRLELGDMDRATVFNDTPADQARAFADQGFEWLNKNEFKKIDPYYLYSLERACSLTNTNKIGDENWYTPLSEQVARRQKPDGSWSSKWGDQLGTAWTILFLVRATGQMVEPPKYDSPGEKPQKQDDN